MLFVTDTAGLHDTIQVRFQFTRYYTVPIISANFGLASAINCASVLGSFTRSSMFVKIEDHY